jgi:hypothetical protein
VGTRRELFQKGDRHLGDSEPRISSAVDADGLAGAYRKVYSELSRSQVRWISRSDIKLVGSQNPLAVDAIAHQNSRLPTVYRGRQLGSMIIEEAYIYPG